MRFRLIPLLLLAGTAGARTPTRANLDSNGAQTQGHYAVSLEPPAVSRDGRWVAFASRGALTSGATVAVYRKDRVTRSLTPVSVDYPHGYPVVARLPSNSDDGRLVIWSPARATLTDAVEFLACP